MRVLVLLLAVMGCGWSTEVLTWDAGIAAMRAKSYPAYCVYIGRGKSELLSKVRAGQANTNGIPIIHLGAQGEVLNPYTNQRISGSRMIINLVGPLNDLTGGSLLFFDADGVMMPEFTAIQNFHRNRTEVIELYCQMVTSPMRAKMSLAEFARLQGMPIGVTLAMEVESGRHKDFGGLFREIPADEIFPRGVDQQGSPRDPRNEPAISVLTRDPAGEVFIAQVHEIWEKLSIPVGKEKHTPPLRIFGPVGARYPALDALGIRYEVAFLTDQQLAPLKTPKTVIPGTKERLATEVNGFCPGQVLASYMLSPQQQALVNNHLLLHPDIPIGDTDYVGPSP